MAGVQASADLLSSTLRGHPVHHASAGGGHGGGAMAEGLCGAVEVAMERISPHEDVRGFLQQALLPALSPAIEELLHHIHESGELQRALRERAAQEHEQRRRAAAEEAPPPRPRRSSLSVHNADEDSPAAGLTPTHAEPEDDARRGEEEASPESRTKKGGKRPRRPSVLRPSPEEAATPGAGALAALGSQECSPCSGGAQPIDPNAFDPLAWLAAKLRESALGPTDQYREQIEQLIREEMAASEAAEQEALRAAQAAQQAAAQAAQEAAEAEKQAEAHGSRHGSRQGEREARGKETERQHTGLSNASGPTELQRRQTSQTSG